MSHRPYLRYILPALIALSMLSPVTGQQRRGSDQNRDAQRKEEARQRAESLRAICGHLEVSTGSVIADIGAGSGRDSWTFADIVGPTGQVWAEEIEQDKCDGIEREAEQRDLPHVKALVGTDSDPKLVPGSCDLAFMHSVYHHLSKPREMLQAIWKGLKPGGYLVVVDQRRGTLQDWVPRADRAAKHYWIAETTVVREARESGYLFVELLDSDWHAKEFFVLVFQRPKTLETPDRDPDRLSTVPVAVVNELMPPAGVSYQRIALVALGEARTLADPLLEAVPAEAIDIILEEWATRKDERPTEPPLSIVLPSLLTDKGVLGLAPEPIDAVYFLDSYHLLFHGPTLLSQFSERLTDDGRVYVLDRAAPREMAHREASHRRMISPALVKKEMSEAGYQLVRECPPPVQDRFLLVFAKAANSAPATDK